MQRHLKLIFAFLLFSICLSTHAQDTSVQQQKKERLEREISIIDKQLAENESKSSTMLANLTLIRKKVANRRELVKESNLLIRKYTDEIYLKQREINRLKARIDTLSNHYSKLVLSAYKNRDARVWYMYMLASDNLGQAFRRYGYFKNLSSQLRGEAQKIKQMQAELEDQKLKLSEMKKEAEAVKAQRAQDLAAIQKEETQAANVVKRLQKDRKTYEKQLSEKRKQVNALNREIERIIAEAVGGDSSSKKSKSRKTTIDYALDKEFAANKGKLPWPADGPVVGRYGQHYHPVYKRLKLPMNHGIDIALSKNADVCAVFDGVVLDIAVMPGYNQCVIIQHGNYFSFYCKIKSLSVQKGDKVKTGQVIGKVDTIDGQNQLNFQIWKGSSSQNPESWLR